MPHRLRRPCVLAFAVCLIAGLAGCAPHRLRGTVLDGPNPAVMVVDAGDKRAQQPGIGGAVVEFTIDPEEMKPKRLSAVATDDQGRFDVPVSEIGAGLLEYQLGVVARMQGYSTATGTVPLPSSKQRLIVIMTPGRDTYRPREDVLQETIRMGKDMMR